MSGEFEVRWEAEIPGTPEQVWDALTVHSAGYLWKIDFEPFEGGRETGLSETGGKVTRWEPHRHFTTEAPGNRLDYQLEPRGTGTYVRYVHNGTLPTNFDVEYDACCQHTDFYRHSLGAYVQHFAGREPVYVSTEAPADGFAAVRRAFGLPDDVNAGAKVTGPYEGVVDYATHAFLGIRTADSLIRVYGRGTWGYPTEIVHHAFAADADEPTIRKAWRDWVDGVFDKGTVA